MSNISRRDFLKTAGVMTLAVAAAGVLAGCEGNNNTENNLPETGDKALGDVTKIGDYEFSVSKAVQQDNVKYVLKEGGATEKKVLKSYACVLLTVRNAGENANAKFAFNKLAFYVNGKKVSVDTGAIGEDDSKKLFGVEKVEQLPADATAVGLSRKENAYWAFYEMPENMYKDGIEAINSLEVTYYDAADKTAVNYKATTPLTVVEYEQK